MKEILRSLLVVALLAGAYSCNDNDNDPTPDPNPDPTKPGTYTLSQGLGILEDIDDEGLTYYRILLSSIPADEDWTFDGAGQALYLELVGPSIDYDNEIGLPAGTYKYSTSSDKALSIVSGTGSRFEHLDVDGKATSYGITEGEIVVTQTSGRYNITGTVKSSTKDSVFTFKFDSNITFTDEYKNGEFAGEFTSAEVYYRNKFYGPLSDNYIITFTSPRGHSASIEIITPGTELHTMVPEGKYDFARSQIATYNLLGQENTYLTWGKGAQRQDLEGGQVEIVNNGDGTFTVEGSLTPENGSVIDFTFNGRLQLKKMRLIAYDLDILALGTYWMPYSSQYECEFYFESSSSFAASTICVMSVPRVWWEEYFPLASGTYAGSEDFGFNVFAYGNCTFIARNKSMNIKQDYYYTGGSFEFESQSLGGDQYGYNVSATTTAIIKRKSEDIGFGDNPYEEEGDEIEIEFVYEGLPYTGSKYAAKPFSKLKEDIQVDYLTEMVAVFHPYYWYDQGAPAGVSHCMYLILESEDFDYKQGEAFMYIDLNIPTDATRGDIPTGTYTPNHEFTYEPFTYNLGYCAFYQYADWGTVMYTFPEDDEENLGLISISPDDPGSIVISRDGDIYTIIFNVYDDQGRNAKKISGTFQGELLDWRSFEDESRAGDIKDRKQLPRSPRFRK